MTDYGRVAHYVGGGPAIPSTWRAISDLNQLVRKAVDTTYCLLEDRLAFELRLPEYSIKDPFQSRYVVVVESTAFSTLYLICTLIPMYTERSTRLRSIALFLNC